MGWQLFRSVIASTLIILLEGLSAASFHHPQNMVSGAISISATSHFCPWERTCLWETKQRLSQSPEDGSKTEVAFQRKWLFLITHWNKFSHQSGFPENSGTEAIYWGSKLTHSSGNIRFKKEWGTSPVAQWLRIRLPMQGTWVRALVGEDPTCCRATKCMCHNYWACTLEPTSHNY